MELELPQVSLLSLNENQRTIVSLVLDTLYNFVEIPQGYHPLQLVVSGTAGTGKSYVIKLPSEVSAASVCSQRCNTGDNPDGEFYLPCSRQDGSQFFRNTNRSKVLQ